MIEHDLGCPCYICAQEWRAYRERVRGQMNEARKSPMPSPEPQNGTALPPLSANAKLCRSEGLLCVPLREREDQLRTLISSLARIHALALDLQRGTNVVPVRAVVDEIARPSNPNAAEETK